jgi:hypothetical protein
VRRKREGENRAVARHRKWFSTGAPRGEHAPYDVKDRVDQKLVEKPKMLEVLIDDDARPGVLDRRPDRSTLKDDDLRDCVQQTSTKKDRDRCAQPHEPLFQIPAWTFVFERRRHEIRRDKKNSPMKNAALTMKNLSRMGARSSL